MKVTTCSTSQAHCVLHLGCGLAGGGRVGKHVGHWQKYTEGQKLEITKRDQTPQKSLLNPSKILWHIMPSLRRQELNMNLDEG